ncbi:hypothetical protein [Kitasatospora sp. NPDC092286]|uniref:hypothetical protein n=1 Tax=Kitasatospora sp. NPDC092286 TaxID=3364087 RepID=UPI0038084653
MSVRRATYWALSQSRLSEFVTETGFEAPTWHAPEASGFFQPLLTAGAPGPARLGMRPFNER